MVVVALPLLAYLLGSIPFGVLVGYALLRRDIRAGGSGHSGATNVIRQAGKAAGAVVAVLDVAKGALAIGLAMQFGGDVLTTALSAGAVVAGHCWPIFVGFRGGMGLGPALGALLMVYPLGALASVGVLIAAAFVLKHSARAGFTAAVALPPIFWGLSGSVDITVVGLAVGLVVAVRALSDWQRKQRAVWLAESKTED